MANQTKPKRAVSALLEAANVVQRSLANDEYLPTDIRDDATRLVNYLRWLADYHRRERAAAQKHSCADSWTRMYRMMLALAERDENAYSIVVSELGDCQTCWNTLLRLAISHHTSENMLRVGGADKLADALADELKWLVMR
ncbi:hypothetical protein A5745_16795 [Mycobacterium sp. IS-2888]|uniref:hypothetical protein n=1 Tax=Mycobacterium sp. IS-2888 TaxID=1834159 RepID=UPI00096D89EB|nr:hypothetical protein [Mycobacterium sp. IS-2888]OMC44093.1 hypothetical protein A5745_16795 [Mycobacterium sp. IS-2888]